MPDLVLERATDGLVAGVDEAGRGPWAGPVVAAAVVLELGRLPRGLARAIDDSKKLSPARRLAMAEALRHCARIGIGAASAAEIDTVNVLAASLRAMARAVAALGTLPDLALIDGPHTPALPCPAQAVIGGDGRSLSIAAASIVAKVTRDRIMARLDPRYPGFGWAHNSGYGTAEHRAALMRLGITPHHRKTFKPIHNILGLD